MAHFSTIHEKSNLLISDEPSTVKRMNLKLRIALARVFHWMFPVHQSTQISVFLLSNIPLTCSFQELLTAAQQESYPTMWTLTSNVPQKLFQYGRNTALFCLTCFPFFRTSPIYSVTATYCLCSENNCNPPIHPVIRRRSKPLKSGGKTVYFANQQEESNGSIRRNSVLIAAVFMIISVWHYLFVLLLIYKYECLRFMNDDWVSTSLRFVLKNKKILQSSEIVSSVWKMILPINDLS